MDNYFINPKFLRWDSILKRVFDMDTEGNEARREKLTEAATLKSRLENNNYASTEEKRADYAEYEKLSELLDWKK